MAIVNPTQYQDPTQEYQKYIAALSPDIQAAIDKQTAGQVAALQGTLAPEKAAAEERLKGTLASRGLSYSGAVSGGYGKIGSEYLRALAQGTQGIQLQGQQDFASRLQGNLSNVLNLSAAQKASQERWALAEENRKANLETMEKQAELEKELQKYLQTLKGTSTGGVSLNYLGNMSQTPSEIAADKARAAWWSNPTPTITSLNRGGSTGKTITTPVSSGYATPQDVSQAFADEMARQDRDR